MQCCLSLDGTFQACRLVRYASRYLLSSICWEDMAVMAVSSVHTLIHRGVGVSFRYRLKGTGDNSSLHPMKSHG